MKVRNAAVVALVAIAMAGCGSDDESKGASTEESSASAATDVSGDATDAPTDVTDGPDAPSNATDAPGAPASGEFVLLDLDPCSLLTVAEIEAALGSAVERGGFGEDQPGRCTHSIGGDVGAGVVGISLGDPLLCTALDKAINAGGTASGTVVAIGQGGIVATEGGSIQFLVGGGCVGISGSDGGDPLDQDALVTLATAAAGRVG